MVFKYRIKGKVNNRFVLRGLMFNIGTKMDFCVSEEEIEFVKKYCDIVEIIDLDPQPVEPQPAEPEPVIETPDPIQETKIEEEVKNELPKKQPSRTNKTKSKAKV